MVVSLFSYRKGNSFVHTMNPLVKFIFFIVLSVSIFSPVFSSPVFAVLQTAFFFTAAVCIFAASKTPSSRLKSLRFVLFLGFFVTLFKIIQFDLIQGRFIFGFDLSHAADGLLYTARFFTASLFALVFFETTSPLQLQESLELVQNTIAKIIPPVKKVSFALYLSLAISFIPEVFSSWQKIKLASRARNPQWRGKKKILKSINVFFLEFSALLSIMIERAVYKRRALINRMQYGR